jgi:hypothetical protein
MQIAPWVVALGAVAFFVQTGIEARADNNVGARETQRFVGESDNGNFQAALEDALAQADAFYATMGADLRYNYRVRGTSGERGGFVFFNIVRVEIVASLQ